MPAPNLSEKRLLWFLILAIFIALNLGVVRYWSDQRRKQDRALTTAQQEISEGRTWLEMATALSDTSKNLAPLPENTASGASTGIINAVREATTKNDLTLTEETLLPTPKDTIEPAVAVRIKLNGPFRGLVHFLYALQAADKWCSVEQITVKADPTPQNVLAEIELRQYYKEGTASTPLPSIDLPPTPPPPDEKVSAPASAPPPTQAEPSPETN